MNKSQIRKKIFKIRKQASSKKFNLNSNFILSILKKERIKGKIIGGYYPYNFEINTLNLFKDLEKKNYKITLPKINKKAQMKNGTSVDDNLVALIAKIGEKITIGKTRTISSSSSINYQYLHTIVKDNLAKLAVVVSIETNDNSDTVKNFGKQLSMHIAASNPLALESSLIDKEIIEKEQELVTEELKNSGKPENIAKKISLGKMNKFKEENALLTQAWVMEPKKKVQDVLKELAINDLKIKEFSRIKIGE